MSKQEDVQSWKLRKGVKGRPPPVMWRWWNWFPGSKHKTWCPSLLHSMLGWSLGSLGAFIPSSIELPFYPGFVSSANLRTLLTYFYWGHQWKCSWLKKAHPGTSPIQLGPQPIYQEGACSTSCSTFHHTVSCLTCKDNTQLYDREEGSTRQSGW